MDYNECCRSCLQPISVNYVNLLTDFKIRNLFEDCTRLKVKVNNEDALPKYLCLICSGKCNKWKEFQEESKQNETFLINWCLKERKKTLKTEIEFLDIGIKEESDSDGGFDANNSDSDSDDVKQFKSTILNTVCKVKLEDIGNAPEVATKSRRTDLIEDESIDPEFEQETHAPIRNVDTKETDEDLSNPTETKTKKLVVRKASKRTAYSDETDSDDGVGDDNFGISEMTLICRICNSKFARPERLQLHLRKMHIPVVVTAKHFCKECDKGFKTERELKAHAETHITYSCDQCENRVFKRKKNLKSHILHVHVPKESYSNRCTYCGKTFVYKHLLDNHVKLDHLKELNFICNICGKRYVSNASLLSHQNTHNQDKSHVCKICSRAFNLKSRLTHHMTLHTGEKRFKCQHCGRCFRSCTQCKQHTMTHTGERPHVCTICNRGFIQKSALRSHMKTHEAIL